MASMGSPFGILAEPVWRPFGTHPGGTLVGLRFGGSHFMFSIQQTTCSRPGTGCSIVRGDYEIKKKINRILECLRAKCTSKLQPERITQKNVPEGSKIPRGNFLRESPGNPRPDLVQPA